MSDINAIQLVDVLENLKVRWSPNGDVSQMPAQVLAYVGDALYEAYTRLRLLSEGPAPVDDVHRRTVAEVRAESQAQVLEDVTPILTPDEVLVVRRGRNAHTHRFRKGAQAAYSQSTAFEALIGFLFLSGRYERLQEIMAYAAAHTSQAMEPQD